MSKDRTIATDALEILGLPDLGGKQVGRDAIHLAVEPAVAGEALYTGARIYRMEDGKWYACGSSDNYMAIVDPFLDRMVPTDGRFLAVVPPRQITSLRHVWEHPAFPTETRLGAGTVELPAAATSPEPESSPAMFAGKVASEQWLRDFARNSDCPDFDTVIGVATGKDKRHRQFDDEYLHFDGRDAHGEIPDEFWDHLEVYTGRTFTTRAKYFSCGC